MDSKTIFTKTAKGLGEVSGKTKALSRDLRNILKEIDGKSPLAELVDKVGSPEPKVRDALNKLMAENYIREFAQPTLGENTKALDFSTMAPAAARKPAEPVNRRAADFSTNVISSAAPEISPNTEIQFAEFRRLQLEEQARHESRAKANKEADEKKRREQEARVQQELEAWAQDIVPDLSGADGGKAAEEEARKQAEELAQLVAQEQAQEQARAAAQAKAEAEAKARAEAEAQARAAAEAQARAAAEAKLRAEAEAKVRAEAEAKIRAEAEAKARAEAEAKARAEAEAKAKLEAQEKARREAEEAARRAAAELQAKKAAEEQAKRDAELKARKDAEDKARLEAEQKARQEAEAKAKKLAEEQARAAADKARAEAEQKARQAAEEKARREAEDKARAAEEKVRLEAEQKAKLAAEEKAKKEWESMENARREAEAQKKREAEERTRLEAEQQKRKEAEALIRKEAEQLLAKKATEEQLKREAEEAARKQAEQAAAAEAAKEIDELARLEEQERARSEAEAKIKQEAERKAMELTRKAAIEEARKMAQQARQEADQKIKHEAQALEKKEAEDWVRREVEERERLAAAAAAAAGTALPEDEAGEIEADHYDDPEHHEEHAAETHEHAEHAEALNETQAGFQEHTFSEPRAERHYEPMKWIRRALVLLLVLLIGGIGLLHVISFDSRIAAFEKAAAAQFGQPVKIKAMYVSLLPQPHWKLEGVSIGGEGQITAPTIKVFAGAGTLIGGTTDFKSVEMEAPVLTEAGLDWLLFGKLKGSSVQFEKFGMNKATLQSTVLPLGAFDVSASMGSDGAWKQIVVDAADSKLHVQLSPKGEALQMEMTAGALKVPLGATLALEHVSADGTVSRDEINLTQFRGSTQNGTLVGTARLKRDTTWKLNGQLNATYLDAASFAPVSLQGGKLNGDLSFAASGPDVSQLLASPRLEGNFAIRDGVLLGVDLASLLRNANVNGKTSFSELNGAFLYEGGKLQLRKVGLGAGLLAAKGTVDMDQEKNLSGRFLVEIKSSSIQSRANLNVAGTVKEPRFSP
jgi:hypothetical protein